LGEGVATDRNPGEGRGFDFNAHNPNPSLCIEEIWHAMIALDMSDYSKLLREIGLNESEAKIYLTNLEYGPASAQILATRSGFSRPAAYTAIDLLEQKGLLSSSKHGKRLVYTAAPPEKLVAYSERKAEEFRQVVRQISSLIPDLHLLEKGERPPVKFYEGASGLREILQDLVDSKPKETFEIANIDSVKEVLRDEELKSVQSVLSNLKAKGRALLAGKVSSVRSGAEARQLPEHFKFHGDILIYGDKVAMVSFKGKIIGVVTESPIIAQTLRVLFDLAWEGAREFPSINK
jgi:sugar-specific transcriptional regulator TrmB